MTGRVDTMSDSSDSGRCEPDIRYLLKNALENAREVPHTGQPSGHVHADVYVK